MNDFQTYLAICSEKTLQTNSKGFFLQFADSVQDAAGKEWVTQVFGKLKTDRERIRSVYNDSKVKDIVHTTLSHVQEIYRKKSAEVSLARRIEAQKALYNNELTKSLMLLCHAVLRAPKSGEFPHLDGGLSLCLALWTRSEVLMRMNKYTLALHDVQLAMKEGLPPAHKAEAFWRMAICYKALKEDKKSEVSKALVLKLLNNNASSQFLLEESLKKDYINQENVSNARRKLDALVEHAELPGGSSKIEVKSEPQRGRFIVAKETIPTGELIVQEEAYAACLLPECFGSHCHHCFNRLESPVGCGECSSVAFCSIECRDKAVKTYHKHECHFLDLLIGSGMSILAHVALRMVTQQPIEYLLEKHNEMSKGVAKGVYSLCTLADFRSSMDFLQRTIMAAFLLRCLQKSGYFGYVNEKVTPNENQFKIGEILLYNLQMLQFNAHEIYETKLQKNRRLKGTAIYIGVAVYQTAALFNHDCSPALTRHFVGKHIVLRTSKPIKSGLEIADNYGPNYSRKTLSERQKYLKGRYWFECKCTACAQNWPKLETLDKINPRVKCHGKASKNLGCDYLFTLPVKSEHAQCPRCKNKVNLKILSKEFENAEDLMQEGLKSLMTEKIEDGINYCCRGLDAFYTISTPPYITAQLSEECLQALFADSGNVWDPATLDTPNKSPEPKKVANHQEANVPK